MDTAKMPSAFVPDPSQIPAPPQLSYEIPALPEHKVVLPEPNHLQNSSGLPIPPKVEKQPQKNIPVAFIERNFTVIMQIRNALNGVVEVELDDEQPATSKDINANANDYNEEDDEDYSDDGSSDYDPNRF